MITQNKTGQNTASIIDSTWAFDHLGHVVRDLNTAINLYQSTFGFNLTHTETLSEARINLAFLSLGQFCIELLEPMSGEQVLSKFLEKRGPGLHHVCYRVVDIRAELQGLKQKGFLLIDETPRKGARGHEIAFIKPSSCEGILTELCQ